MRNYLIRLLPQVLTQSRCITYSVKSDQCFHPISEYRSQSSSSEFPLPSRLSSSLSAIGCPILLTPSQVLRRCPTSQQGHPGRLCFHAFVLLHYTLFISNVWLKRKPILLHFKVTNNDLEFHSPPACPEGHPPIII